MVETIELIQKVYFSIWSHSLKTMHCMKETYIIWNLRNCNSCLSLKCINAHSMIWNWFYENNFRKGSKWTVSTNSVNQDWSLYMFSLCCKCALNPVYAINTVSRMLQCHWAVWYTVTRIRHNFTLGQHKSVKVT